MKIIATLSLSLVLGISATAQTTITNGDFELWGNTVPAGDTHEEPTNWYSNQSGSSIASLGGQTCFKDATIFHSGLYSVRLETISGPFSTVINGSVTTGVVDAPTITKTDGYIGTVNTSSSSDDRRMSFTGRPDSLVGWYQYTSGGTGERAKIRVILHTGDYYDPETPTTYHPDPTANKIADGLFLSTPSTNVAIWTRFSIPFTYVSAASPAYIMINATPSADQGTTITGSKLWLDDLQVVYTPTNAGNTMLKDFNLTAFPNPVKDELTISIAGMENINGQVQIMDVSGRTIKTSGIDGPTLSMSIADLSAGVYFIRYVDTKHTQTIKINKQ